jgi:hypothetical protein
VEVVSGGSIRVSCRRNITIQESTFNLKSTLAKYTASKNIPALQSKLHNFLPHSASNARRGCRVRDGEAGHLGLASGGERFLRGKLTPLRSKPASRKALNCRLWVSFQLADWRDCFHGLNTHLEGHWKTLRIP